MLKPVYLVAFSGHRPEETPGRTSADLEKTAPRVREVISALVEKAAEVGGEVHFLSGIAAGADIVACEVARSLGLPLHIILPKDEDAFFQAFPGPLAIWKPRAEALLAAVTADRHCTLRVGGISHTSPDCYAEANTHMLEAADLLLTISNGEPSKSIAGTSHLIGQAIALGLPHLNIDSLATGTFTAAAIPPGFANKDSHCLKVFRVLQAHVSCDLAKEHSAFDSLARCLSIAAEKSSGSFRKATAIAISLHALAGFIAAAATAFYFPLKTNPADPDHVSAYITLTILALLELVLVAVAFGLESWSHKSNDQHVWLNCRFARELMRGIHAANPFLDPLFPEVRRHQPNWKRFAVSCGLLMRAETGPLDTSSPQAIDAARTIYLQGRIQDQLLHFRHKAERAHKPASIFKKLVHYAGPAALVVVLLAFLVKADDLFFHGHHRPAFLADPWIAAIVLLFLPIFVPLLASLSASFLGSFDFGRRKIRYKEMHESLSDAGRWLSTLSALANIRSAVRHTEEVLLDEQIEWLSAQKSGFGH